MQTKEHFKLYKSGKMWVSALVGAAALVGWRTSQCRYGFPNP